jgi:hypothetical protein
VCGHGESSHGVGNEFGFARETAVQRLFARADALGDVVQTEIAEAALGQELERRRRNALRELGVERACRCRHTEMTAVRRHERPPRSSKGPTKVT